MRTSIGSFFLWTSSGDSSAHDDRLHLPPVLCDRRVSWYAQRVARAPSPLALLARLHARRFSWAKDPGRGARVAPSRDHRMALWTPAQSGLLERAPDRPLVGSGS